MTTKNEETTQENENGTKPKPVGAATADASKQGDPPERVSRLLELWKDERKTMTEKIDALEKAVVELGGKGDGLAEAFEEIKAKLTGGAGEPEVKGRFAALRDDLCKLLGIE